MPGHVINTFCWITYTYTLPGQLHKPLEHVGHPGLGNEHLEEKRYHSYYQWVPFMLFFQVRILIIMRNTKYDFTSKFAGAKYGSFNIYTPYYHLKMK